MHKAYKQWYGYCVVMSDVKQESQLTLRFVSARQ